MSDDSSMSKMRSLLSSYYGTTTVDVETKKINARDIDSSAFEAETYVRVRLALIFLPN